MAKELGKIDPVTSGEGVPTCASTSGRSEKTQATVYQKHMALLNLKMTYKA